MESDRLAEEHMRLAVGTSDDDSSKCRRLMECLGYQLVGRPGVATNVTCLGDRSYGKDLPVPRQPVAP